MLKFVKRSSQINYAHYFFFQLFDRCLAPNTIGDGTGCDNMTCIIVRWKKPGETNGINSGSANETKVAQEAEQKKPTESTEASTVSPATKTEAEKRCASPDTDDTSRKRSKIDEGIFFNSFFSQVVKFIS